MVLYSILLAIHFIRRCLLRHIHTSGAISRWRTSVINVSAVGVHIENNIYFGLGLSFSFLNYNTFTLPFIGS